MTSWFTKFLVIGFVALVAIASTALIVIHQQGTKCMADPLDYTAQKYHVVLTVASPTGSFNPIIVTENGSSQVGGGPLPSHVLVYANRT